MLFKLLTMGSDSHTRGLGISAKTPLVPSISARLPFAVSRLIQLVIVVGVVLVRVNIILLRSG